MNAFFNPPAPVNEPVLAYAPNSPERAAVQAQLKAYKSVQTRVGSVINGVEIHTENAHPIRPPHELAHILGTYSYVGEAEIDAAIAAALSAKAAWSGLPWQDRAAIFLKAADLLCGKYRPLINASTMLGQSKNIYQAEIDAACELADFFRFNVHYLTQIYAEQPISAPGVWNRLEYRPLEGFVFAVSPFNFTSICANLAAAPALMGNTVVWKPSETQLYSAKVLMDLFKEAGLPNGVINMVIADAPTVGNKVLNHPDFAGLHFTGSTATFKRLWKQTAQNLDIYKSFPRLVGETGGKDFVLAHASANIPALVTALTRGAFEYQGQKCSAASRAYIPASIWEPVKKLLLEQVASLKMGTVEDFGNFVNAVIDERAFDKIKAYIDQAHKDAETGKCAILAGGGADKTEGYFIQPTIIQALVPDYVTMQEEIFAPVLSIYVYPDADFDHIAQLVDSTSPYALTGAIFATDRNILNQLTKQLEYSAGNFYINDKPTGAVVGQQPFGGGRLSGTNDKAGAPLNLLRWVSPRTIKENFVPPTDYPYPFLKS